MADRALRPEEPARDVFDLEKDDRWQARLAEARARRAIALREKANSQEAPKRRLKPWEEAGQDRPEGYEPIEPLLKSEDDDKLDFSDRVRSLRETVEGAGGNGGPSLDELRPETSEPPSREADAPGLIATTDEKDDVRLSEAAKKPRSVADRYIKSLSPDFTPVRPFVPQPSLVTHVEPSRTAETRSADETERLARDYAATIVVAESETPATEAAAKPAARRRRRGMPALLLAGVCLLAVLPFTKTVPPMDKGPASGRSAPQIGLQPALGITRPMNAFPRSTTLGEWTPVSGRPPRGPLVLPLETAVSQQRFVAALLPVPFGDDGFGTTGWSAIQPVGDRSSAVRVSVPATDRLPGVAAADPIAEEVGASEPLPAPLSLLSVTIMVPRTTDPAIAETIADDLLERGHELSALTLVDLKISERNIRFFHEEDRGEAARLAEAYDARLRDFTSFRPSPAQGTVEIWLAGEGLSRPAVVAAPRQVQAQPTAPTPRVVIVRRSPSFLERIFGGGHEIDGTPASALKGGSSALSIPSSGTSTDIGIPGDLGGTGTTDDSGVSEETEPTGGTDGDVSSSGDTGTSGDTSSSEGTDTSADTGSSTGSGSNGNSGNGNSGNGGGGSGSESDTTADG
jgi:hypothetical protein